MTLVLACVTLLYVTAVADRRLSRGSEVDEDFATKAVVICDRGAVLYSGIARLGPTGPRMDDWIVQILASHKVVTLSEAAKALRVEATASFRRLPYAATHRRHAFMIVGWQVIAGPTRQPVIAVVSNALDDEWNWLSTSGDEFRVRVLVQQDTAKFSVATIGANFPQAKLSWMRRSLRRGFARGIGPRSVIRLSANAIRSVAALDPTVGKNLLAVYVPPCSLEGGSRFLLASAPGGAVPTYLDIRMPFDRGTQHGPHFVCGDTAVTGVVTGSLDSSDDAT